MKPRMQTSAVAVCALAFWFMAFWMVGPSIAQQQPPGQQPSECLDCHRQRNLNANEGILSSQRFCYNCHQDPGSHGDFRASKVSFQVKPEYFLKSPHRFVACIQCHTSVAQSPHRSLSGVQCSGCHPRTAGSPGTHAGHQRVRCEACHTDSPFVKLDAANNEVKLSRTNAKQVPISLAEHKVADVTREDFCTKCHVPNNQVGAPAMVLPSKSFVCIACHYSPMSIGPPVFLLAIFVALMGIVGTVVFWFRAGVQGETTSVNRKIQLGSEAVWSKVFSREIFSVLKTVFFDILLQRRILANGVSRWLIHSLIFYSFFARFALSVLTLYLQKFSPEGDWTLILVNRDSSFVATFNDLTGVFILVGVIWAMVRRFITKPEYVSTQEQDTAALVIIGLVALSGFILEGMRFVVGQIPPQVTMSAFAGYLISRLFSIMNIGWESIYGYVWYTHALLWALFIAYLPFGKLKHIFTTPLSLLLNYKKA